MSSTWYEFKVISFSALERILILQKKKKIKIIFTREPDCTV